MYRCSREVTWVNSLSSLPEQLCVHVQSTTSMSASSDCPSIQVQICDFIAEYRFWMVFGVLACNYTLNAIPSVEVNSESSRSQSDLLTDWSGCSQLSKNCGHYRAFIRSSKNSTQWFSVDDQTVHNVNIYLYAHPSWLVLTWFGTQVTPVSVATVLLHAILSTIWRYTHFLLVFHVHIIGLVLYNVLMFKMTINN